MNHGREGENLRTLMCEIQCNMQTQSVLPSDAVQSGARGATQTVRDMLHWSLRTNAVDVVNVLSGLTTYVSRWRMPPVQWVHMRRLAAPLITLPGYVF